MNPYESPEDKSNPQAATTPPFRWRAALIGFAIGAALPTSFAVNLMRQEAEFHASLPKDTLRCGMGTAAAMILIIFVGPFCGAAGALIAWGTKEIRGLTEWLPWLLSALILLGIIALMWRAH